MHDKTLSGAYKLHSIQHAYDEHSAPPLTHPLKQDRCRETDTCCQCSLDARGPIQSGVLNHLRQPAGRVCQALEGGIEEKLTRTAL
jgi:hypothetical protein